MAQSEFVLYRGEEWSALYHNGKLLETGDDYLVIERLLQVCSVEVRQNEDFLLGLKEADYNDVPKDLESVEAYAVQARQHELTAQELRERAKELLATAKELETQANKLEN